MHIPPGTPVTKAPPATAKPHRLHVSTLPRSDWPSQARCTTTSFSRCDDAYCPRHEAETYATHKSEHYRLTVDETNEPVCRIEGCGNVLTPDEKDVGVCVHHPARWSRGGV